VRIPCRAWVVERQLGCHGLAEDDRAGVIERFDRRGAALGNASREEARAVLGRNALGVEDVLDAYRHAMERTAQLTARGRGVGVVREPQRAVAVEPCERVHLGLALVVPREALFDNSAARRQAVPDRAHRSGHIIRVHRVDGAVSSPDVDARDILAFRSVPEAQLSPDGTRIAYVVTEIDAEKDEYRSSVWLVDLHGGGPVRLTRGPKRDTAPRWSPDGRHLAFLSDRADERPQLYVLPLDGGEPRKLTSLDGGVGPATWAPDSRRIAFSGRMWVDPPPADAAARKRWEARPRHVTRAQYKADGEGYTLDRRWHLFVVDLSRGALRQLTSGDAEDRGEAWSPDGHRLAFSRSRIGTRDHGLSDIHVFDVASGEVRRVSAHIPRAVSPTWSPDGATIACYGRDLEEYGTGDPMLRVWTVPSAGGEARCVTADYDRAVVPLPPPAVTPGPAWTADGRAVSFIASDRGSAHIVRAELASSSTSVLVGGRRQVAMASVVAGRGIAFVAGDLERPADVYWCAADGSGEKRLTDVNGDLLARLRIPRAERRSFTTPYGHTVDGWILRPAKGAGPAPLLVDIHGGPASFAGDLLSVGSLYRYALAERGWAVLQLNPTGSGSYGRDFAHAIRGKWGEYDLAEQLAAVDALVAEGIADPERLAVTGYSYGGFMTSWTIGHTDRFRAAVVGAPLVDQASFHGTSDIGPWFTYWEMQGDIRTARETYQRLSPIEYVDRVTCPTLVLQGEADERCPIGQGEQLYMGLVAAGKVPTELVRYPGSSHLFLRNGRPSHRVDYNRRVIDWMTSHVPARVPTHGVEVAPAERQ
jgi:dipeptidyl aminopeptidase/acylaminoacyl peptidase